MPRQDEIFVASEGDRWFERNRESLECFDPATDLPLKLIDLYRLKPSRVLEVGAANGFRLAAIHERYQVKAVAVEPSARAVRDGKARFPRVEFVRGDSALPFRASFDLVIVNFVFHWIDRARLLSSVAELDRVLADGGYLIIGDFYPVTPLRTRYHHLSSHEIYTYKQNYAATFLASGLYYQVGLLTGDHSSKTLMGVVKENERFGVWLLCKTLEGHYVEGSIR